MLAAFAAFAVAAPLAAAAKRPVYRDPPSYDGRTKAPATKAPPKPPQPEPITLAGNGYGPHTVVDDAGTAHVVWTEGGDQDGLADRALYCRIKRGTRSCDASATLTAGPETSFNTDYLGPRILRVGDQLIVLSSRYPEVVDKPSGASSTTIYAWTSNDGGTTWSDPAIVGNRGLGDTVVMGPDDDPTILNFVSDGLCGGLCIQAYKSGQYSGESGVLGLRSNDAYYPQIELENGLPVVSWVNLDGTTYVRRWTGQGSVIDPLTWSQPIALPNSDEADLAGGPHGLWLLDTARDVRRFRVRSVTESFGSPVHVSAEESSPIFGTLEEDESGRLLAAYSARNDFAKLDGVWLKTFETAAGGGGKATGQPAQRLIRGTSSGQIDLAATSDGGGFAVFNHTGFCCDFGEITAAGFGNQLSNGKKGLGDLPGGGTRGGSETTCQKVKFGSFTADAAAGCFLHGKGESSHLVITAGEINLHGVRIIPEGSAKIVMDPKKLRLDTTGSVRVVVSNPLVGEITLWRGELHRDLSAVRPGTDLFEFPIGEFATNVLGFDVGANVQVKLEKDGVHVPLSLKLPPAFGGFSGNAELISTTERGLILDSLHIELGPIPLGFLIINKVSLDYVGAGDIWRGAGSVTVPAGGTLDAVVEFKMGDFNSATISFTPATPIPIGPFVYLLRIGGGFTVEPVHIEASAKIGAGVPIAGTAPVNVDGKFEMDFPKNGPGNFKMSGTVNVFLFEVGNGCLQFQTDGYAAFGGQVGPFSLGPLNLEAKVGGFVDADKGQFGADLSGKVELCIDFEVVEPCVGAGADVALSNAGFAACANFDVLGEELSGGIRFPWGDFSPDVLFNPFLATVAIIEHVSIPCDTEGYHVPAPRPASARVAQAGGTVVSVPRGVPSFTALLKGDGGAPSVTATGPEGQVVKSSQPTKAGFGASVKDLPATYLVLNDPAPGDWTIVPDAGSPAITQTMTSEGYEPASVRASLGGRGRKRSIRYRISNLGHGQRVVFTERGAFGTNIVGSTAKRRGTLRFTVADATGGKRRIVAMVEKDGLFSDRKTIGSYKAPGPEKPGKVKGLRAKRKTNGVVVRWRPASGVARYSVTMRGSHGTSVGRLVGKKTRKLRFSRIRRDERLTITVQGISKKLRRGPAAKEKLKRARR